MCIYIYDLWWWALYRSHMYWFGTSRDRYSWCVDHLHSTKMHIWMHMLNLILLMNVYHKHTYIYLILPFASKRRWAGDRRVRGALEAAYSLLFAIQKCYFRCRTPTTRYVTLLCCMRRHRYYQHYHHLHHHHHHHHHKHHPLPGLSEIVANVMKPPGVTTPVCISIIIIITTIIIIIVIITILCRSVWDRGQCGEATRCAYICEVNRCHASRPEEPFHY